MTDQESKPNATFIQDDGAVVVVHLDVYMLNEQRIAAIVNAILAFPPCWTLSTVVISYCIRLSPIVKFR
jgi:hypothetical protein